MNVSRGKYVVRAFLRVLHVLLEVRTEESMATVWSVFGVIVSILGMRVA